MEREEEHECRHCAACEEVRLPAARLLHLQTSGFPLLRESFHLTLHNQVKLVVHALVGIIAEGRDVHLDAIMRAAGYNNRTRKRILDAARDRSGIGALRNVAIELDCVASGVEVTRANDVRARQHAARSVHDRPTARAYRR